MGWDGVFFLFLGRLAFGRTFSDFFSTPRKSNGKKIALMALPAVASDGETVVVAEAGNLNADHGRGLQYSGACVRGNV